jgi:PiT family inorganic phosphate transporter
MGSDLILIIVIAAALAFDFTNGFHDTANVVATSVSTRALPAKAAITGAAILNFAGAFISLEVAATVGNGLVETGAVTMNTVFAGLIGAIAWNIATWYAGLPSSSSHALLGGIIGAVLFAAGPDAIIGSGVVDKVLIPAVMSPTLAFVVGAIAVVIAYRAVGRRRPGPVTRGFRHGQLVSGGLLALAHGTNDGQKTMGIMTLALIAHGDISANDFHVPGWVVVSAATAIAAGTYAGGWRIINTLGNRIHKMDAAQGFAAQTSGAVVILSSSHFGFPLSTTHTISGAVIGSGAAKRLSSVRWGVAGNMVVAWILTLPAAGLTAGLVYEFTRVFGKGAAGPAVVTAIAVAAIGWMFTQRARHPAPVTTAPAAGSAEA